MSSPSPSLPAKKICFQPIGVVQNEFPPGTPMDTMREGQSRILIKESLLPALTGLEAGRKILVLFHFHHPGDTDDLLQHPRGDQDRPRRGVFALRTPNRPNRIGAAVVKLLEIQNQQLTVQGLDAWQGTPVLDIKPAG